MRPVLNRDEYLALRSSEKQLAVLKAVRSGDEAKKRRLVQMNYSCIPADDGRLKGSTRMSTTVGMDIDHVPPEEMCPLSERILSKKDELGLKMLEKSARERGYHLVFSRRPELSQEANLEWASQLLNVAHDEGAKDITRVFYTTSAEPEDLIYLDDSIFACEEAFPSSWETARPEGALATEGTQDRQGVEEKSTVPSNDIRGIHESNQTTPSPSLLFLGQAKRQSRAKEGKSFKGTPYADIIDEWWRQNGGVPQEGERNVKLYQLAVNLRSICDNNRALLMQIMPRLGLSDAEMAQIVDSACKEPPKGIPTKLQSVLRVLPSSWEEGQGVEEKNAVPSNDKRGINEFNHSTPDPSSREEGKMDARLWKWGEEIEGMMEQYPALKDICKGLKKNQYPAAMFVGGGLLMTLMTRCTYRFYHRPEELRRLNNSTLIIGDPASGKSFATRLFKLLAAPIVAADRVGKDAINTYREQMRTKGANKEKPKKPKVIVRIHPARTSNAQFIQDMVNSVEEVDGQPMQLHMLTFDTELDNTVTVQKGGSWIDKFSMELKAFHNEEDGQAYSNNESILQDFIVTWNFIYTGTPIALKKKVNEQNFGSGLATRLTCIPLPATNFQMMTRESTVDYDSDNRLKEWAVKLDRTKGELSLQKIVDELYDWTARRMMDAEENDSRADEMLLKRCAYHGLNFAAPFIVMRHWAELHQDGEFWCGEFETDDTDWKLAELIVNIQYACQRHYFGAMAQNYFDNKLREASVNVRRQSKTFDGFERLPEEFTSDDVMRCFNLNTTSAARMRISRLTCDHLIEKIGEFNDNGKNKARFRKTGVMMC